MADGVEAPRPEALARARARTPWLVANDVGHDLGHALGALRGAVPHVIPAVTALIPRPPSPLAGPVGPRRVWVSVDIPLAEVKSTGRALGATVNDVVLACVTGGFRDLLVHRGEPVEGRVVRNLVPVSMRPPGDDSAQNRISGMLGHLPVGIADPVDRLAAVRAGVAHGREVWHAGARIGVVGARRPHCACRLSRTWLSRRSVAVHPHGSWTP